MIKSRSGLFSKKEYMKQKKKEKEFSNKVHRQLKKQYKKIPRIKTERKNIQNQKKGIKIIDKKIDTPKIFRLPSPKELNRYLYRLTDKYDEGIKKTKKIDHDLHFWGFRKERLVEYKNERPRSRSKRIKKIKRLNEKLLKTIEKNKHLERQIDILHKKLMKH